MRRPSAAMPRGVAPDRERRSEIDDVYAEARALIRDLGPDAWSHAEREIDRWTGAGRGAEAGRWVWVALAVEALLSEGRVERAPVRRW